MTKKLTQAAGIWTIWHERQDEMPDEPAIVVSRFDEGHGNCVSIDQKTESIIIGRESIPELIKLLREIDKEYTGEETSDE